MKYDVAVVGLGGMGSAILAHCAARGASAIGLEQFGPAHNLGSSHGRSRMIRKAYFEDPAYVPLLQRAYQLWHGLERATGTPIMQTTGVLTVGRPTSKTIAGTRRASAEHNLPLESLSRREVESRYPMVRLLENEVAVFEKEAGVLGPEAAVRAQLDVARSQKAQTRFNLPMESWRAMPGGFELRLADRETIAASSLVLSLGPWFKTTLEELDVPIRVQRNVQAWFEPMTTAYDAPGFPAFLVDDRPGLSAPLYGFPNFGAGVKAAFHGGGEFTDAQHIDREINLPQDVEPIATALAEWLPGAMTFREASACMYTLTPDEHFVVDRHPDHPKLILCGGFSGHGFKFAPVIGEIAADLVLDGGSRHDINFLSLRRFRNAVTD